MNVAITGRSSLSMGGGEQVTMTLARQLHERGHDVTLFVPPFDIPNDPDSSGTEELSRGRKREEFDIRVTSSPLFDIPGIPLLWKKMLLHPYVALSGSRKEFDRWFVTYGLYPVSEYYYDRGVSITHYFHSPIVADKAGLIQKYTIYPPLSALYAVTENSNLPAAANSMYTAEAIRRHHGIECEVVYPPVDTDYYGEDVPRSTDGVPEGSFILLSGRFVPFKKFERGLKELEPLVRNSKVDHVVVAGRLDNTQYYDALRSSYEFADFRTDVPGDTWRGLHQHADAYLFTNHEEDFGLTGAEAMAAGTPLITVEGPGIAELITNRTNGFTVDKDFSGLEDVVEMAQERHEEIGAAGRKTVIDNCGAENFVDRMLAVDNSDPLE